MILKTLAGFAASAAGALAIAQQSPRLLDVHPTGSGAPVAAIAMQAPLPPRGVVCLLDDGVHGLEPWILDGTPGGGQMLVDLTPGPASTQVVAWSTTPGRVWFVTTLFQGSMLWVTDGTPGGTQPMVGSVLGPIQPPGSIALGDVHFFGGDGVLWRTDGTGGGTFPLLAPAATPVAVRGSLAILQVFDTVVVSDGFAAAVALTNAHVSDWGPGKLLLHEFLPSNATRVTRIDAPGAPSITLPGTAYGGPLGDGFLFSSSASTALWGWDGVGAPEPLAPNYWSGAVVTGGFVFTSDQPGTGLELWFSDGTTAGTHVLDLEPGPASSTITLMGALPDGRCLFWRRTAATGSEPWLTDGTLAGTVLLKDVEPGPGDSLPELNPFLIPEPPLFAGSRRVMLPITTSAHGREVWISDGTTAGTNLVADVFPGPQSSLDPGRFVAPPTSGNTIFWSANDGLNGDEIWALDLDGFSTPLQVTGTRRLVVADPVLGATWELRCTQLAPADLGLAIVGLPQPAPVPLGGGQFVHFVPSTLAVLAGITPDPAGKWSAGLALPNTPSLTGLDLVVQALFVPSLQPGGVDFGDAWWVTLGF